MASADFWKPLRIPHEILSPLTDFQTSPGKNNHLPPHPPHLLHPRLMAMGFALSRKLAPWLQPEMRFVFLGSEFCLGLLSGSTSRWIVPLPLANSFHHQDL